ncbi:UDP-glycosyltransferase 90A1-like [Rhododendron vialii]|uniref:UDP-glycosyltransferase 90A1-like n=1 Tax=Rhododendron vialii TaxID=182163 RepID=UPI00265FE52B|nr:UDP-glycosyltransferase 90A1-like [Rhododendron vialii]
MAASPSSSRPHIVLFPFMSKGHTIPLLHLARLLLHRNTTVTIFTTPANQLFISDSLSHTDASIVELPFPQNIDGVPAGVESTDKLPSMSLFPPFAAATKLMQPNFEQSLETLPNVTCIISDGFLGWTLESATKFGIPRLVYYGMSNYSNAVVMSAVIKNNQLSGSELDDDPFAVTDFPWIKLTRNDFDEPFNSREPEGPHIDFIIAQVNATSNSYGLVTNSFCELEELFVEYWNRESKPKSWCIGPLCLAEPLTKTEPWSHKKPTWLQWLDQKLAQGSSVLYVAFGSQAEISSQQLREIEVGLEKSKVNFLWVTRKSESELDVGFQERVKGRGLVVRDWVDQRAILRHESVRGFLSHCGWNSVLESVCAKVPILAWPMMAEQHINARMVVEEIKVGLRVETSNGSVRGFVKCEGLEKMVRELMEGEMGKEVRKKVKEFGEAAKKAVEEGGSSWHTLNQLIDELHKQAIRSGI